MKRNLFLPRFYLLHKIKANRIVVNRENEVKRFAVHSRPYVTLHGLKAVASLSDSTTVSTRPLGDKLVALGNKMPTRLNGEPFNAHIVQKDNCVVRCVEQSGAEGRKEARFSSSDLSPRLPNRGASVELSLFETPDSILQKVI